MLVRDGAKAMLADLNDPHGQALAAELGGSARFVHTDVCDEASARAAVAAAQETFGSLSGRGNCAGIAIAEKIGGKERPHALESFVGRANITLIGSCDPTALRAEAM